VVLDDSFEYTLYKRYKEFRIFHDYVKETLQESYIFPKFPGRTMSSMSPAVISKRKLGLEKWLHCALSFKILEKNLKIFLEIPSEVLSDSQPSQKINEDEVLILDFASKISSSPHSKTNLIDQFDKKFFGKRRNIRDFYLNSLLVSLIPLCADEYFGSKALFSIYKLCNSVHYRDFELAIKELAKIPVDVLSSMKLNEYLLKKRFCDGQIQAFHILNELKLYLDDEVFLSVLNQDQESWEVFQNWDGIGCISKPLHDSASRSEWRALYNDEDFSIQFRFIQDQLEFLASFLVESDMQSIVELLIVPSKRKSWDLKLVEMEEVVKNSDGLGVKLVYSHDRSLLEFHNSVRIEGGVFNTKVHFKSKVFPQVQLTGALGSLESYYKLETLTKNDNSFISNTKEQTIRRASSNGDLMFDELEKLRASIKVTWKATFCENSKKLLLSDCFQETDFLRKNFTRFLEVAESRPGEQVARDPSNSIWQACERKKLRKLSSMRKISGTEEI